MKLRILIFTLFAFVFFIAGCEKDSFYEEPPITTQTAPENEAESDDESESDNDAEPEDEPEATDEPEPNDDPNLKWNLPGIYISSLANGGEYLWAANSSDVYKINKVTGEVTPFFEVGTLVHNRIDDMKCDNEGIPWISLNETGLVKIVNDEIVPINASGLPESIGFEIDFSSYSDVWCSYSGGLYRYNGSTWTNVPFPKPEIPEEYLPYAYPNTGPIITTVKGDNDNNLWIGLAVLDVSVLEIPIDSCLLKYDGETWTSFDPPTLSVFSSITIDENNNLWLAPTFITKNLYSFDGEEWVDHQFPDPYSKASPRVNVVEVDDTGSVWVGSDSGLYNLLDENWTLFDTSNSEIPGNRVYQIVIDSDGTKWIATDKGLAKF